MDRQSLVPIAAAVAALGLPVFSQVAPRRPPRAPNPQPAAGPANARPAAKGAAAQAPPLDADVKENPLGPHPGQIWVSGDGGHVAIVAMKGSRPVMMVDGVEGPSFDELGPGALPLFVRFSPDGRRLAYMGRRGEDLIAVVDGKETRVASARSGVPDSIVYVTNTRVSATNHPANFDWFFHFTPDGSRLAFLALTIDRTMHLVEDGVMGPGYPFIDPDQIVTGGKHIGYVAQTRDQKWHAVLDKNLGQGFSSIRWLQLTPDGSHSVYVADSTLVEDGKDLGPVLANNAVVPFVLAPDGRVAYSRTDGALVVNGREIQGAPLTSCVFNPDGKGFAYVRSAGARSATAVIDGRQGPEYNAVSALQYSRDGKRSAYIGQKGGLSFLVVDGKEAPGQSRAENFRFSDDGRHYAYQTYKAAAPNAGFTVVIDGTPSATFRSLEEDALTFSPNSQRYAYAACTGYSQCQVIQDGASTPVTTFGRFQSVARTAFSFPRLLFSPDSSRMAYIATTADGTGRSGVIVGDQKWPPGATFSFPSFSPDSRHFAAAAWRQGRWTVMVDGRAGPEYEELIEASPAVFRFVDNRTLSLLAVKEGRVSRVEISLRQ